MKLYHTSPVKIEKISNSGLFGSFLCFSDHVYKMSAAAVVVYNIEIAEESMIEASSLFYHENAANLASIVAEVADRCECDTDAAEDLISEKKSVWDVCASADSDLDFYVQHATARAAAELGYRGVVARDEQGTVYLINMFGKEGELNEN